jgi:hypothetical protein
VWGKCLSEKAGEGAARVDVYNNFQSAMLVVVMGIGTRVQWKLVLRRQTTEPKCRQMQMQRGRWMMEGREDDDLVIGKCGIQTSIADGLEVEIAR